MSGTTRRLVGALLFVPIIVLVAVSQSAAQWLLMALAALMVLEFSAMLALPMALRAALLMDSVLFALPAPVLSGIEAVAGMPLDLVILALAALVIGLIWAVTRNGLASIFIALIIACIVAARGLLGVADGNLILLVLAAAVASCDITAYFVGRRIGGAKLAPSISPNKTCSGAIGGTVGAVAACLLVSSNSWLSPMEAVVGGICLAVLAQAGDLIESALKRRVGVKDSGSLIPGHGGFLDRFDGYLLTLPAVYLYILAIQ
ncbi:MAG: phosphatidate cytidylyltransferase [Alphaproteobacteria bacterium]|nr:phosphatidate cytidylyltransferase [Alphaproteobacteria bacterium]